MKMQNKELEKKEKREVAQTSAEQLVDSGNAYLPDVDIYDVEDQSELLIVADLPGVKKGDAHIEIDENNTLFIRGKISFEEPTANQTLRQFYVGDYYRAFSLSNQMNKDKVVAAMNNGVLEIRIPR